MKWLYIIILIIYIIILYSYDKYKSYIESYSGRVYALEGYSGRVYALEGYKNEPYITVFAKNGLNNKLQVVLSYLYKAYQERKELIIYWILDEECPDRFDNLFEPIKNVTFIYKKATDESMFDYITYLKYKNDNTYIDKKFYKFLKPKLNIQNKIKRWILKLNNKFIACHIRRTDLHKNYNDKKHWWYKPKILLINMIIHIIYFYQLIILKLKIHLKKYMVIEYFLNQL
jgi:hypothetical protein